MHIYLTIRYNLDSNMNPNRNKKKRKKSDTVLWQQKPLHQQKCQKGKITTQTTQQKCSITQPLRTDLGRSVLGDQSSDKTLTWPVLG